MIFSKLKYALGLLGIMLSLTACVDPFGWFFYALTGICNDSVLFCEGENTTLNTLQTDNTYQLNAGESLSLGYAVKLGCLDLVKEEIDCSNSAQFDLKGPRVGSTYVNLPEGFRFMFSASQLDFKTQDEQRGNVELELATTVPDGLYDLSLIAKEASNSLMQEIPIRIRVGSGATGGVKLTVARDGEGKLVSEDGKINCFDYSELSRCSATYTTGSKVLLSAVPAEKFERWLGCSESGGSSDGHQCFLTMNNDNSVFAQFFSQPE